MKLYNTLSRKTEEFKPIQKGVAGIYACGPTVYNYAHIGNMRAYIWEDVLRRALEFCGFTVRHVMNITDVGHLTDDADDGEDKMLKSSRESGKSVWEIAQHYTDAFFADCRKLNILKPHVNCKATEHIDDMIKLIQRIEAAGYAYQSGGNVYFDTSRMPAYGKLALLDRQEQKAGARIEIDSNKNHPRDFVLWFTNSKFENQAMQWDSPWGRGYPGWHIECSAMSIKYLGETFDIHCGGVDHVSVHHTNEIAQSEAATGQKWVNYWLHVEFLRMEEGKMSKSSGNFITVSELEKTGYSPLDFRYLVLGAHYRSQLAFSYASIDAARSARQNIENKIRAFLQEARPSETTDQSGLSLLSEFQSDLEDDLNTPRALSRIWNVLKHQDLPVGQKLHLLYRMDEVLGLGFKDITVAAVSQLNTEQIDLIRQREEARKNRDWKKSDEIRNLLLAQGVELTDTAEGTKWTLTL